MSSAFVTAGLAIFLAIWIVSSAVAKEKHLEQNTESQKETVFNTPLLHPRGPVG